LCVSDKKNEPEGPERERVHVCVCVYVVVKRTLSALCVCTSRGCEFQSRLFLLIYNKRPKFMCVQKTHTHTHTLTHKPTHTQTHTLSHTHTFTHSD